MNIKSEYFNKKTTKTSDDIKSALETIDNRSYPLLSFQERNKNTSHVNYKVYHLLCKPYIFVNAYAKIIKNKGALTKGIKEDEEIMKFFGKNDAENIAENFKKHSYKWNPSRRTWIPKPGKKEKRPIDTPTQKDRIVQEAIRGILESIYEPVFTEFETNNSQLSSNYGFRPNKSCWTAVEKLKLFGQSTTYAIEGDISGAYNNVDHDILIQILQNRIKDNKFINILRNLLKTGIMEKEILQHSLKGTPQGGIISPLLFNIYMFELDKFVYDKIICHIKSENQNKKRKRNPEHTKLGYEIRNLSIKRKDKTLSNNEKYILTKKIKIKTKQRFKIPSYDIISLPKNAIYTRYADDWVLLITGSFEESIQVKNEIKTFIKNKLKMELDNEKTLISKLTDGFNFLGYTIKMYSNKQYKISLCHQSIKGKHLRYQRRTTSRKINIFPDKKRLLSKLYTLKFTKQNGYPIGIRSWSTFSDYDIVLKYKQIFRGLCNYYSKCDNHYILNRISYILLYSCAKTLSNKKKVSMSKIFEKYGNNLTITKEMYKDNKILTSYVNFTSYTEYKKQNVFSKKNKNRDFTFDPFNIKNFRRTKTKIYLNCCICNSNQNIALHHTNSLGSINPNKRTRFSYIKSMTNRNQIPVCQQCHLDITLGRYSKQKPIQFYNEYIAKL